MKKLITRAIASLLAAICFPTQAWLTSIGLNFLTSLAKARGLVEGATRVDAYRVDNHDLQAYVEAREKRYEELKAEFENKGYDARREFLGSEDGEAMMIRASDEGDWHFYDHLDPTFFEL